MLGFFNFHGQKPGYLELSQAFIEEAQMGRIPADAALPPSRVLAESLGISRDTVLRCYRHLKNLGWTESHGTRGTFVSSLAKPPATTPPSRTLDSQRLSDYGLCVTSRSDTHFYSPEPIIYGAVPKRHLPIRRWKKATQDSAEPLSARDLQYWVAVLGRPELRSAVSTYLNCNRGIACIPDEVAIFSISFNAFTLICRLFLEPGEVIAMEEPGYGGVKDVASYLGLKFLPVPLDAEGISVTALEQASQRVKVVCVSPNHQEPTGITMTLSRRKQLLAWAQRTNALIIEDDYDGLFHYGAQLPPSLKSMDTQDNVIYLGSFWQLLYPLTTLCFAVVPYSFIELLHRAKQWTASLTENLAQLALADMLNDGYLQKHNRKLEREFGTRRRALMYELKRAFASRIHVPSQTGGLTIMVRFVSYDDNDVLEAAQTAKLALTSTLPFYFHSTTRVPGEFLLYFADLDEATIRKTVENFAANLERLRSSRSS